MDGKFPYKIPIGEFQPADLYNRNTKNPFFTVDDFLSANSGRGNPVSKFRSANVYNKDMFSVALKFPSSYFDREISRLEYGKLRSTFSLLENLRRQIFITCISCQFFVTR